MEFNNFNDSTITKGEMHCIKYFDDLSRDVYKKDCLVFLVAEKFNRTENNRVVFFVPGDEGYMGYYMNGDKQDVEGIICSYKYDEVKELYKDMKTLYGVKTDKTFNEKINDFSPLKRIRGYNQK